MKIIFQWMMYLSLGFLPWSLQGLSFTIQDLGTLALEESVASGINNHNVIVGRMTEVDGTLKNFIWHPERGLISLPCTSSYQLPLINNHHQMVNLFWHRKTYWLARATRSKHLCILQNDGTYEDIGAPQQWKMQVLDDWQQSSTFYDEKELGILSFNDHQEVLIANSSKLNKATQFAVWQGGAFKDIDPNILKIAYRMNNQSMILGRQWVETQRGNIPVLVLYDLNQGTTLPIMRDTDLINREFNDQGQVIVTHVLKDKKIFKGLLWDALEQDVIELEDLIPIALNNRNQVVGYKTSQVQKENLVLLLWDNGEVTNINKIIGIGKEDCLWSEVTSVQGINDNGYIIGQGIFDGKKHAFVLIPFED